MCVKAGTFEDVHTGVAKRPLGGTAKHAASNQLLILRLSAGKLPLQIRSGSPPLVFVLEGSLPEKLGEKNWPV